MEDTPNEKGLEFYDKVFDELNKYGIKPLVTISHYEMPYAPVEECNGWASRRCMVYVDKYDDGTGDLSRKKKDSFFWYKKVIETNGEEI